MMKTDAQIMVRLFYLHFCYIVCTFHLFSYIVTSDSCHLDVDTELGKEFVSVV